MPLCQVNIAEDGIADAAPTRERLARAMARHPQGAPVIVLIHGYKFSPNVPEHDPHTHILSLKPRDSWKAVSWPRRLGLGATAGQGRPDEPLCLALGWEARGSLWQAYAQAELAGRGLAAVVDELRALRPGLQVKVLAHSLGARVALSALPHLPAGAVGRAVLLAAAEMQSQAVRWLDCPAGRVLDVLNVTSRENDPFDMMLEWLVAPHRWGDRALGQGLGAPAARWRDLQIDDAATRERLRAIGFPIPAPDRRVCHWSVYLRPGLFDLYRALLAGDLTPARLRGLLQQTPPRRTARLLQRPLPVPTRVGTAVP